MMIKFLLVLIVGCVFMTTFTAANDPSPIDDASTEHVCLSQASFDIAQEKINSLNVANAELVKVVEEVMKQVETKKDEFAIEKKKWKVESDLAMEEAMAAKESLLEETRNLLAQAVGEIESAGIAARNEKAEALLAAEKKGKEELDMAVYEAVAAKEALLQEGRNLLAQARDRDIEAQLEISGFHQQVADLESELRASQQQVASQLQELTDLRKVTEDLRDHAHEARKAMQASCKAQLDSFICDFSSCQEALLRYSGLRDIFFAPHAAPATGARTGGGEEALGALLTTLRALVSTSGAAVNSVLSVCHQCWRQASGLYSRLYTQYLEKHVDTIMRSEPVLQLLEHVDYLEGKTHVFLYYVWKDTPRVFLKVTREVQYFGYFLHWKGKLALSRLAVVVQGGLIAVGVQGVSLSEVESVCTLLGFGLTLIICFRFKKQILALPMGFLRSLFSLLLWPYWIVTKPVRIVYGLFFK